MGHKFHILDVFTERPFCGNQLAVVEDADDLDAGAMQAITREFGFSETVFLQTSSNPLAEARLRIFTPGQEIAFAGHPTVGGAVLLAGLKGEATNTSSDALIMMEQEIGLVRSVVSMAEGAVAYAEFDAPKLPEMLDRRPEVDLVADALSLSVMDIGFENHVLSTVKAGGQFIFVPLRNIAIVRQAAPDFTYWEQAFGGWGPVAVYVYCRHGVETIAGYHGRMFAPALGVQEDAATGSAAVAFAALIDKFESDRRAKFETYIEQGYEIGRPSLMKLEVEFDQRMMRTVRVGGMRSGLVRVNFIDWPAHARQSDF